MNALPVLNLYVTDDCSSCARTRRAIRECARLQSLVAVVEHRLGDLEAPRPRGVVAGPTLVFDGIVVWLGTPDSTELADRLEAMIRKQQKGERTR
ncbi:MAG: thioredoxin family protein [Tepidiformaceae bacterium]